MLRDQTEDTMDMKVLEEMQLEDEAYLERIGAARLVNTDQKLHPTAAGLLMFGDEYKILYEFPEYFLDYREILDPSIRWTDRLQSSSGDWTGNLFDFFFRVYGKLVKDLKIPFMLEGATRIDDTPVHRAVREALANCLVNTDFYLPRGIVIKKEADGIIMENPGSIRTGKRQMLKCGISDPRNKALMKMFNMIGIGERAGSGVPDIYAVWESQGWIMPRVIEEYSPDRTFLQLLFIQKPQDKKSAIKIGDKKSAITEERLRQITEYMNIGTEYRADDISAFIGLKASRVRELLKILAERDVIKVSGKNKNRRYQKRQ